MYTRPLASFFWLVKEDSSLVRNLSEEEKRELGGKWGHPIMILAPVGGNSMGRNGVGKMQGTKTDKLYVLLATSFSNHEGTLAEKFPGHRGAHMRAKYLPLNREPLNPHPDNGILLDVVTTGNVKFSKDKQSYLNLTPFSIRREWIIEIQWRGKAQLTASAFDTVKKHIAKLSPDHPVVALWTEEKTIAITARRVPARFSTTKESAVGEQGFSMWTYRQESASYNYNYYTPYQPPRAETRGFCATLSWTVFWIVFCLLAIFWYEGDSC